MTQDPTSNPPPRDFEDSHFEGHDVEVSDFDANEVETLLLAAFDAPPVPNSLGRRLDDGIEQQWGKSPEIAPARSSAAQLTLVVSRQVARVWPYAVGMAAAGLLAVFIAGGSGNYAWATVIEAMKRQGVVQIQNGDNQRWLDLAEQVAGERNARRTRWVDLGRQLMLTRSTGSGELQRQSLGANANLEAETLLTAFLLDQPLSEQSLERLRGTKLVEEDWSRVSEQGRKYVQLQIRMQTADDEQIRMSLQLDPDTKLPRRVEVLEGPSREFDQATVALDYLTESSVELRAEHFPHDLAVVSVRPNIDEATPKIASLDRTAKPGWDVVDPDSAARESSAAESIRVTETQPSSASPSRFGSPAEAHQAFVAALPVGAANQWKPVVVISRSDRDVLHQVDSILDKLWQEKELVPVDRASDVQLLRRAYLDLAGRTPTVSEVREYLSDDQPERYERLVDRLLNSPDHASQMAAVWRAFLIPEGVDLDAFGGREAFEKWLAERFGNDESYDSIVRKLLLADGRLSQSGPLLFYSALKLDAHQLAAKTSRVFLGMRLECAQCHDHPFEPWTQEDFWSFAAFFARISRPKGELENVSTVMRVHDVDRGEVMLPETDRIIPPRFLGQVDAISANDDAAPQSARRQRLAHWLTGPQNPYFARATVNRLWGHLFGRGIVDPIDDFGELNPPVSPELLDTLASQFIDSDFDLKRLLRTMALSKAYRLSSSATVGNDTERESEARIEAFAQMNVKTLTAEQLYDCIAVATMMNQNVPAGATYTLARFGNSGREQFLQQFASPAANRSEYLAGIPQALTLMNGSLISGATGESSSGVIQSLSAPFFSDKQRIDVLFMSTLSRPARPDELDSLAEFLPSDVSTADRAANLADLLWALINSSEFTLNH